MIGVFRGLLYWFLTGPKERSEWILKNNHFTKEHDLIFIRIALQLLTNSTAKYKI